ADWSGGGIELLVEAAAWPRGERVRRAGISAFGISGTNAHVIVEEAPQQAPDTTTTPQWAGPVPWILSGKSPAALDAQATKLHTWLEGRPDASLTDVGAALALTRSRFEHRAVISGSTRHELLGGLQSLGRGELPRNGVRGVAPRRAKTAFLFTGQGAQRPGAGRELAASHPVFAQSLDEVCAELDRHLDRPLRQVMFADEGTEEAELLHRTDFTQPALFALETALYRLVASWGFSADFLVGHSVGELVAVHAAGVLSLADACGLVAARGRLMQALPAAGGMTAVQATEDEVRESLRNAGGALAVAGVNGPNSTVVSGPRAELDDWQRQWEQRGRRIRRLRVSQAFHSPLVRPMLADLAALAAKLEFRAPAVPVVSNVTGAFTDVATLATPDYWVTQAEQPVRFHDCVRTLERAGVTAYLELGPDGVLTAMTGGCLETPAKAVLATSLHRSGREPETLLMALAELAAHGASGDLAALFEPSAARRVSIPTYAFQTRGYWADGQRTTPVTQARPVAESAPATPERLSPDDTLSLVRIQTGLVLGHEEGGADGSIDGHRTLLELGIDSLAAVRLQRRLSEATGLDLPATLLVDHPTPAAIADHLRLLLSDRPAPEGTYTRMLREAHARGELPDAVPRLREAARRLPSFDSPEELGDPPESILVSDGSQSPVVVCVPSFLAGSGPHMYARFAAGFERRSRMWALTLPGFGAADPPPATWRAAVDSLAAATARVADGAPVLLVGHSIGGVLAHAVAAALESAGYEVAGVVLMDTYEPEPGRMTEVFGWAMGSIIDRESAAIDIREDNILAMGGYLGLLDGWRPDPLRAPSLLLSAAEGPAAPGSDAWPLWSTADSVTTIPGDHFSILETHAADTARTIEDWLRKETPCSPSA
ncbi:alpha/beta fold hydrolase, partial [Streptomyces sp. NPDC086554]|uniref:alpha/beta fold hydrolase n=1 Tax=Streptomyces sp. NPDC086554 TaxID=3154864 RepID=UPI00341902D5